MTEHFSGGRGAAIVGLPHPPPPLPVLGVHQGDLAEQQRCLAGDVRPGVLDGSVDVAVVLGWDGMGGGVLPPARVPPPPRQQPPRRLQPHRVQPLHHHPVTGSHDLGDHRLLPRVLPGEDLDLWRRKGGQGQAPPAQPLSLGGPGEGGRLPYRPETPSSPPWQWAPRRPCGVAARGGCGAGRRRCRGARCRAGNRGAAAAAPRTAGPRGAWWRRGWRGTGDTGEGGSTPPGSPLVCSPG